MASLYTIIAKRVPAGIRKNILEEQFIDKATNVDVKGTPMEYLFDVYEEFIDANGEHDDWNCHLCREHILHEWRKLKPYLEELQSTKHA